MDLENMNLNNINSNCDVNGPYAYSLCGFLVSCVQANKVGLHCEDCALEAEHSKEYIEDLTKKGKQYILDEIKINLIIG